MTFGEALKLMMQHKAVKLPEWGGFWNIGYNNVTQEINIFEADGERVLSQRIDEYLTRTDFEVLPDDKAAKIIENCRRLNRI